MKFFLLDAGGAGLLLGFLILFMLIAILIEGGTMAVMKYNKIGKSMLDALIVNIVSLCLGYAIIEIFGSLDLTESYTLDFLILYFATVAIEFAALYLLNRSKPLLKTLTVTLVMNVLTYAMLYFFNLD